MTIKELQKMLKQFDPSLRVILASDEEGNSFADISDHFGSHIIDDEGGKEKSICLYPDGFIEPESVKD